MQTIRIGPQLGPQTQFLKSAADIVFYGGAAGGGKSFGLLLDPLYGYNNKLFKAALFRRTTVQLRNPGSIWDQSQNLYRQLNGKSQEMSLEWTFPSGASLKMAHLEYEKNAYDWQGSELAWVGFDEVTHFTERQVTYMMSRMRSMSGIKPRMRATCNPDAESWVRDWVDWYIGEDGYAIPERSGKIRWFIRIEDNMIWADSATELIVNHGKDHIPMSFTFIPSKLDDNKILMDTDPSYRATLMSLPRVERERLLKGNWNVKPSAGAYFQKSNFEIIDIEPAEGMAIRHWDRASTKPHEGNKNPDWTVGLKMKRLNSGVFVICDVDRFQESPAEVEKRVRNCAIRDRQETVVGLEQDPGSAGAADIQNYVRLLAGFQIHVIKPTQDKITRALGFSSQSENKNIKVVRGKWNDAFFKEAENFPPEESKGKDDQIDAGSGAFNYLASKPMDNWAPINLMGANLWRV